MENNNLKLFEAEHRFLNIIWENEPINSTQLSKICFKKLGWKKLTTYNMIRKLVEKKVVQNKDATVTSLVKKAQVQKFESEKIISKNFG